MFNPQWKWKGWGGEYDISTIQGSPNLYQPFHSVNTALAASVISDAERRTLDDLQKVSTLQGTIQGLEDENTLLNTQINLASITYSQRRTAYMTSTILYQDVSTTVGRLQDTYTHDVNAYVALQQRSTAVGLSTIALQAQYSTQLQFVNSETQKYLNEETPYLSTSRGIEVLRAQIRTNEESLRQLSSIEIPAAEARLTDSAGAYARDMANITSTQTGMTAIQGAIQEIVDTNARNLDAMRTLLRSSIAGYRLTSSVHQMASVQKEYEVSMSNETDKIARYTSTVALLTLVREVIRLVNSGSNLTTLLQQPVYEPVRQAGGGNSSGEQPFQQFGGATTMAELQLVEQTLSIAAPTYELEKTKATDWRLTLEREAASVSTNAVEDTLKQADLDILAYVNEYQRVLNERSTVTVDHSTATTQFLSTQATALTVGQLQTAYTQDYETYTKTLQELEDEANRIQASIYAAQSDMEAASTMSLTYSAAVETAKQQIKDIDTQILQFNEQLAGLSTQSSIVKAQIAEYEATPFITSSEIAALYTKRNEKLETYRTSVIEYNKHLSTYMMNEVLEYEYIVGYLSVQTRFDTLAKRGQLADLDKSSGAYGTLSTTRTALMNFQRTIGDLQNQLITQRLSKQAYMTAKSTYDTQVYYRMTSVEEEDTYTPDDWELLKGGVDLHQKDIKSTITLAGAATRLINASRPTMVPRYESNIQTPIQPYLNTTDPFIVSTVSVEPREPEFLAGAILTTTVPACTPLSEIEKALKNRPTYVDPTTTLDQRACGIRGRFLEITAPRNSFEILQVIVVDKNGRNVAFRKPVVAITGQSVPGLDRITNGVYSAAALATSGTSLFTYTGTSQTTLQLDLGELFDITAIRYLKLTPTYSSVGMKFAVRSPSRTLLREFTIETDMLEQVFDLRLDPTAQACPISLLPIRYGTCGMLARYVLVRPPDPLPSGFAFKLSQVAVVDGTGTNLVRGATVQTAAPGSVTPSAVSLYASIGGQYQPAARVGMLVDGEYMARPEQDGFVASGLGPSDFLMFDLLQERDINAVHLYSSVTNTGDVNQFQKGTRIELRSEDNRFVRRLEAQSNLRKEVLIFEGPGVDRNCKQELRWDTNVYGEAGVKCRYVRLRKPAAGQLAFSQLEVIDKTGRDIALFQPVTVTSGEAKKRWGVQRTRAARPLAQCFSSDSSAAGQTYTVDLGSIKEVCAVYVYGVTDSPTLTAGVQLEFLTVLDTATPPVLTKTLRGGASRLVEWFDVRVDPESSSFPNQMTMELVKFGLVGTYATRIVVFGPQISSAFLVEAMGKDIAYEYVKNPDGTCGKRLRQFTYDAARQLTTVILERNYEINSVVIEMSALGSQTQRIVQLQDCNGIPLLEAVTQTNSEAFETADGRVIAANASVVVDFRKPPLNRFATRVPYPLQYGPHCTGVVASYVLIEPAVDDPARKLYLSQILAIDADGRNQAFERDCYEPKNTNYTNLGTITDGDYEASIGNANEFALLAYEKYRQKYITGGNENAFMSVNLNTTLDPYAKSKNYVIVDLNGSYEINSVIVIIPKSDVETVNKNYQDTMEGTAITLLDDKLRRVSTQLVSKVIKIFGVDFLDFRRDTTLPFQKLPPAGAPIEIIQRTFDIGQCGIFAQYIRIIQTDTRGRGVKLSQVIVTDPEGINIAMYKPTFATSNNQTSSRIVDGNYNRRASRDAYVSNNTSGFRQFIEINLGREHDLTSIWFVNVSDDNNNEFNTLRLQLYNATRDMIFTQLAKNLRDTSVLERVDPNDTNPNYTKAPTTGIGVNIRKKLINARIEAGALPEGAESVSITTDEPIHYEPSASELDGSRAPRIQKLVPKCVELLSIIKRYRTGPSGGIRTAYIRVFNSGNFIQISQLMAFNADGDNLLFGRKAESNSVLRGSDPSFATDGEDGYFHTPRPLSECYVSNYDPTRVYSNRWSYWEIPIYRRGVDEKDPAVLPEIIGIRYTAPATNIERNTGLRIQLLDGLRTILKDTVVTVTAEAPTFTRDLRDIAAVQDMSLARAPFSRIIMPKLDTLPIAGAQIPTGIAVDTDGNVYISYTALNKIVKISSADMNALYGSTATSPASISTTDVPISGLINPLGLACAGTTLCVANTGAKSILIGSRSITGEFQYPVGIAASVDGQAIFVTDYQRNGYVYKYSIGGSPVGKVGPFNKPIGVTCDSRGWVLVSCEGDSSVYEFDGNGSGPATRIAGTGVAGTHISQSIQSATTVSLRAPYGITACQLSNRMAPVYFVSDRTNHMVYMVSKYISNRYQLQRVVGNDDAPGSPGSDELGIAGVLQSVNSPTFLAYHPRLNLVLLSDTANGRIKALLLSLAPFIRHRADGTRPTNTRDAPDLASGELSGEGAAGTPTRASLYTRPSQGSGTTWDLGGVGLEGLSGVGAAGVGTGAGTGAAGAGTGAAGTGAAGAGTRAAGTGVGGTDTIVGADGTIQIIGTGGGGTGGLGSHLTQTTLVNILSPSLVTSHSPLSPPSPIRALTVTPTQLFFEANGTIYSTDFSFTGLKSWGSSTGPVTCICMAPGSTHATPKFIYVSQGKVYNQAGQDILSPANSSALVEVHSVAIDSNGFYYFAERGQIRRISNTLENLEMVVGPLNGVATAVTPTDPTKVYEATTVRLGRPRGMVYNSLDNTLLFTDEELDSVYSVNIENGTLTCLIGGTGTEPIETRLSNPTYMASLLSPTTGTSTGLLGRTTSVKSPYGIFCDATGVVYVSSSSSNLVVRLTGRTLSVVSGLGASAVDTNYDYTNDYQALYATLRSPADIAVLPSGTVFIADSGNRCIRRLDVTITQQLYRGTYGSLPFGTVTVLANNTLSSRSYWVQGTSGVVTRYAISSSFETNHIVSDMRGTIYFVDTRSYVLYRMTEVGILETVVELGSTFQVGVSDRVVVGPLAIYNNSILFITNQSSKSIYKVNLRTKQLDPTPFATSGTLSSFSSTDISPTRPIASLAVHPAGYLLVAGETSAGTVQWINIRKSTQTGSLFNLNSSIRSMCFDPQTNRMMYLTSSALTVCNLLLDSAGGLRSIDSLKKTYTLEGLALTTSSIAVNPRDGSLYFTNGSTVQQLFYSKSEGRAGAIPLIGLDPTTRGTPINNLYGPSTPLQTPVSITFNTNGTLFIANTEEGNTKLLQYFPYEILSPGKVYPFAGTGQRGGIGSGRVSLLYRFNAVGGLCVDSTGVVYCTDSGDNGGICRVDTNGTVIKLPIQGYKPLHVQILRDELLVFYDDASKRLVSYLVGGSAGVPTERGQSQSVAGLASDGTGTVYIADRIERTIRSWNSFSNQLSTIATIGAAPLELTAITFNTTDRLLYVGGSDHILRTVSLQGAVTALNPAGPGMTDGSISSAKFNGVSSLAFNGTDTIYISDTNNNCIRAYSTTSKTVTTITGSSTDAADQSLLTAPTLLPTAGLSGDGEPVATLPIVGPRSIAFDPLTNRVLFTTIENRVRCIPIAVPGTDDCSLKGQYIRIEPSGLGGPISLTRFLVYSKTNERLTGSATLGASSGSFTSALFSETNTTSMETATGSMSEYLSIDLGSEKDISYIQLKAVSSSKGAIGMKVFIMNSNYQIVSYRVVSPAITQSDDGERMVFVTPSAYAKCRLSFPLPILPCGLGGVQRITLQNTALNLCQVVVLNKEGVNVASAPSALTSGWLGPRPANVSSYTGSVTISLQSPQEVTAVLLYFPSDWARRSIHQNMTLQFEGANGVVLGIKQLYEISKTAAFEYIDTSRSLATNCLTPLEQIQKLYLGTTNFSTRYLRIIGSQGFLERISQVVAVDLITGENAALNAPQRSNTASNASMQEWIEFDLGQERILERIQVLPVQSTTQTVSATDTYSIQCFSERRILRTFTPPLGQYNLTQSGISLPVSRVSTVAPGDSTLANAKLIRYIRIYNPSSIYQPASSRRVSSLVIKRIVAWDMYGRNVAHGRVVTTPYALTTEGGAFELRQNTFGEYLEVDLGMEYSIWKVDIQVADSQLVSEMRVPVMLYLQATSTGIKALVQTHILTSPPTSPVRDDTFELNVASPPTIYPILPLTPSESYGQFNTRFVRIEMDTPGGSCTLKQVLVIDSRGVNVAAGKRTWPAKPSASGHTLVNGTINGAFTLTNTTPFEVDLGEPYRIGASTPFGYDITAVHVYTDPSTSTSTPQPFIRVRLFDVLRSKMLTAVPQSGGAINLANTSTRLTLTLPSGIQFTEITKSLQVSPFMAFTYTTPTTPVPGLSLQNAVIPYVARSTSYANSRLVSQIRIRKTNASPQPIELRQIAVIDLLGRNVAFRKASTEPLTDGTLQPSLDSITQIPTDVVLNLGEEVFVQTVVLYTKQFPATTMLTNITVDLLSSSGTVILSRVSTDQDIRRSSEVRQRLTATAGSYLACPIDSSVPNDPSRCYAPCGPIVGRGGQSRQGVIDRNDISQCFEPCDGSQGFQVYSKDYLQCVKPCPTGMIEKDAATCKKDCSQHRDTTGYIYLEETEVVNGVNQTKCVADCSTVYDTTPQRIQMQEYRLGESDPLFIRELTPELIASGLNMWEYVNSRNDNRDYSKPRGRKYCVTKPLADTNVRRGIRSHKVWDMGQHWFPDFNIWFKDEGWSDVWHTNQGMAGFDHYRLGDTSRFRKLEIYDRWAKGILVTENSRERYTRTSAPRALVNASVNPSGCSNSVTEVAKMTGSGDAKCVQKPSDAERIDVDVTIDSTSIQEGTDGNFYYIYQSSVLVFSFY